MKESQIPGTTKNLFEWDDSYKINIAEIDKQHKTLFGMAYELNKAMLERRSHEITGNLLNNLISYTQTHFKTEENYFKLYQYPQTKEHIAMHTKLINEVEQYQKDFENNTIGLSIDLLKFLKNWLSNHILKEDLEYGKYLKAKGVR